MKKIIISIVLCLPLFVAAQYTKHFTDNALRIDYSHSGRVGQEYFTIERYIENKNWAGSKVNLIDRTGFAKHKLEMFDKETRELIYSKNFNSLFEEWLTMPEAKNSCGNFQETILVPFPKNEVEFVFSSRDSLNKWQKIASLEYNETMLANYEKENDLQLLKLHNSGKESKRLDIMIIPVGYTIEESKKMMEDLENFKNYIFSEKPFTDMKEMINVWGIEYYNEKSGIPGRKNQEFFTNEIGVSYNTFGSERYIMTQEVWSMHDVLQDMPYDQIVLMCNSDFYGGGGVYNSYATSFVGEKSRQVLVHELGHSLIALADEYASNDSGAGHLKPNTEPSESNVTTLIDFDIKWKDMMDKNTPIPTPCTEEYIDKIGVFEGAAYQTKGFYRPYQNCMMRNLTPFCPVCVKAIEKMMKLYVE